MPTVSTAALKPAKRQPLGLTVADSLRDAIYAARLRPGQKIGQAVVARELGVSQTTVRDALSALEHEGLVERGVNQGAVVTQMARADIEEIISLRTDLESMAVRRLIRQATPEILEQLEGNIRAMQDTWAVGQVVDLDLAFHELMVRLANHKRLLACWQTLRTQIKLLMVTHTLSDPRSPRKTVENHKQLLKLIKARDEDGAVALLERSSDVYLLQAAGE